MAQPEELSLPRPEIDEIAALGGTPHRRYNPLLDEWVLVSADRTQRPWHGQRESGGRENVGAAYDPGCYLCPGNRRANGERNADYADTFVFTNDFPALRPATFETGVTDGLLRTEMEPGTCRVMCFSPRHDLTLAAMAPSEVRRVVDVWADQTAELGRQYQWVQVFENRGEMMGASNPHPHGQIWAGAALPTDAAREDAAQRAHEAATARPLLLDYAAQETDGPRVIVENEQWLVVVPFWAAWPYETLVVPRAAAGRLPDLKTDQRDSLAATLVELLGGYDRLFERPFPYSMGWHQAPFRGAAEPHWQLHAHVFPPLVTASTRKFMVGYELLAEPQRDLTAETAAERLRAAVARP